MKPLTRIGRKLRRERGAVRIVGEIRSMVTAAVSERQSGVSGDSIPSTTKRGGS